MEASFVGSNPCFLLLLVIGLGPHLFDACLQIEFLMVQLQI